MPEQSVQTIFPNVSISEPTVLWGITLLTLFIFIVVTLLFWYHWKKYGYNKSVFKKAFLIYLSISALLLLIILGSLISLT